MKKNEVNALLVKIQEGDNQAFENLYEQTSQGVYAFIYSYMKNSMDCEDVLQMVYMKIKNNIHQYREESNGLAWILQIAKNTALNELRGKKAYQRVQEEVKLNYSEKPKSSYEQKSIMEIIKKSCSEEEQKIIILHVIWNYRHKEIAKELNIPIGTVTSKYKRAIAKVKIVWKEETK